jgi:hypothetical protein
MISMSRFRLITIPGGIMEIDSIEKLQQAQRQMLCELQEQMIDKTKLTRESRKALLNRYQSDLKKVQEAKKRAIRRFDEEISYYKKLISDTKKDLKA